MNIHKSSLKLKFQVFSGLTCYLLPCFCCYLLPVTCGSEAPPSDKYDDQEDVEKAAQAECGTDDDLKDEEDDGCVGINLHHYYWLILSLLNQFPQLYSALSFCVLKQKMLFYLNR